MQTTVAGIDRRSFFVLPQAPEEAGYYTYGTPIGGAGQYAHPQMLTFIFQLEFSWSSIDDRKFGVGNISLADGASFLPHRSHRSGLEVDMRPLRKDRKHLPVRYTESTYDRVATERLIDLMYATGMVRRVFFNDGSIARVSPMRGHDDHLHVEVMG